MSLVIKNGTLIEPASRTSEPLDVRIEDGCVAAIGKDLDGGETIDASGCVVAPGLVDMHVHFREPGFEYKETIETGSHAAAKGGVTSVVTMGNTSPVIDNAGMVEFVTRRARDTACIKVFPAACATKGMEGSEITEMAELRDVGAVAITDDGKDIPDSAVMRRVLQYAKMVNLPVLCHCEDECLSRDGAMNEGFNSTVLGIPGIPKAAEEIRIERVVRLAALTGAHVHIQHVSTAGGMETVRRAKAQGLPVTCEACPHYWTLTDEAVKTFNANAKINPPLREAEDVRAVVAGIQDGTVDCLCTDHAPHTPTEKNVEFQLAPFGAIGLETLLALAVTELVEPGYISLERALALMTCDPAGVCGLPAGTLKEAGPADVVVFDPKEEWTVEADKFASRSRNSPFVGRTVRGRVKYTLCDGNVVYQD